MVNLDAPVNSVKKGFDVREKVIARDRDLEGLCLNVTVADVGITVFIW